MINEDKLYATINSIVDAKMFGEEPTNPFGPLDDMFSVVEALQNCLVRQCVCTALALMKTSEYAPDDVKPFVNEKVRDFLDGCVKDFDGNLKLNMSANCRDMGFDDITDPNATLREELMGVKYDS